MSFSYYSKSLFVSSYKSADNLTHCKTEGDHLHVDNDAQFSLVCVGGSWVPGTPEDKCEMMDFYNNTLCEKWAKYCHFGDHKEWMNRFCFFTCLCYNHPEHVCCPGTTTTEITSTTPEPNECLKLFKINSVGTVIKISKCQSLKCGRGVCGSPKWNVIETPECSEVCEPYQGLSLIHI